MWVLFPCVTESERWIRRRTAASGCVARAQWKKADVPVGARVRKNSQSPYCLTTFTTRGGKDSYRPYVKTRAPSHPLHTHTHLTSKHKQCSVEVGWGCMLSVAVRFSTTASKKYVLLCCARFAPFIENLSLTQSIIAKLQCTIKSS